MRNFRNYDIWRDSISLVKNIYLFTNNFPKNDAIINQMHRCAISIPSNIAEGASRFSSKEFARFLEIALGSAFELETQIELSHILQYIDNNIYDNILKDTISLEKRISSMIQKIRG